MQGQLDLELPPGFRFHPTDEELVVHYLCRRSAGLPISVPIIAEVDLYKFDPWQLSSMALYGDKEWHFSLRERKYPNGSVPNRLAGTGYWKTTGSDKPVGTPRTLAMKKTLVFYAGKAPKGEKTNWIMHEYRLADVDRSARNKNSLKLDDFVLCRIYNSKGTSTIPASTVPAVASTVPAAAGNAAEWELPPGVNPAAGNAAEWELPPGVNPAARNAAELELSPGVNPAAGNAGVTEGALFRCRDALEAELCARMKGLSTAILRADLPIWMEMHSIAISCINVVNGMEVDRSVYASLVAEIIHLDLGLYVRFIAFMSTSCCHGVHVYIKM